MPLETKQDLKLETSASYARPLEYMPREYKKCDSLNELKAKIKTW